MAALAVNVFIVGINQISDVEIDRVNKPFLPIAAGDLTRERAWWIVAACGDRCRSSWPSRRARSRLAAVLAGLAIGAAYSIPPARLKRFPVVASLCVSGVRSRSSTSASPPTSPRRCRPAPRSPTPCGR